MTKKEKFEWIEKSKKPKLVLIGKPAYINHMYSHLLKEHPSTKKRLFKIKGGK
jgi:hypothetical protein